MKLLVVNPNTTEAMTQRAVELLRQLARNGVALDAAVTAGAQVGVHVGSNAEADEVEITGVTASFGHEVIASRESFVVGAHAALSACRAALVETPGIDAVILACFGDPGLAALQEAFPVPVAGMAQSALREAVAAGRPYRIITAGAAWDAMLRETVRVENADGLFDGICVLRGTGLDATRDRTRFLALVQAELDLASHNGMPTVILGGLGFAGMRGELRYAGLLIDGLEAATRTVLKHV